MAKPTNIVLFDHLRILSVENIQLLFLTLTLLEFFLGICILSTKALLFVSVRLGSWNGIYYSNRTRSINPSRYALLPDSQVILLKLVQVFELAFKFSCHEHLLSGWLQAVQVIVLIMKLLEFNLV